jgi:hypothetical protein
MLIIGPAAAAAKLPLEKPRASAAGRGYLDGVETLAGDVEEVCASAAGSM